MYDKNCGNENYIQDYSSCAMPCILIAEEIDQSYFSFDIVFSFRHVDYLQLLNLFAPGNFPENQVFKLQSQTKVAGTHPRNAVCLLLASLLALPMFFIAVNSLNVHQLWEGKKTAKCPNNFD